MQANDTQHGLMIVLCGLPGSGKSTLARSIVGLAEEQGYPVKHIHFDQDLHDRHDFDPSLWKISRGACLEEAGKYLDNKFLVIMDDTMHYRSMRIQCWKTARLHSSCYCQIYLDCPYSVCCQRNKQRSGTANIPSDIMDRMQEIFEAPKTTTKYPWDSLTIPIHSEDPIETSMIWCDIIANYWGTPAPPMEIESELDPTIRQLTTETVTHQVDIQSRKIISEYVARLPTTRLKSTMAKAMNQQRQAILDTCRKSCHQGDPVSIHDMLETFKRKCESVTCQYGL